MCIYYICISKLQFLHIQGFIDEDNRFVWSATPTGLFFFKVLYLSRAKKPLYFWRNKIRQPGIPFSISDFVWKFFHYGFPVDHNASVLTLRPQNIFLCMVSLLNQFGNFQLLTLNVKQVHSTSILAAIRLKNSFVNHQAAY